MEKIHCDICDEVMETTKLVTTIEKEEVQIILKFENPDRLDVCKNCLTDQLRKEDRRPVAACPKCGSV